MTTSTPAAEVQLSPALRFSCHLARLVAVAWLGWALAQILWVWIDAADVTHVYSRIGRTELAPIAGGRHLASFAVVMTAWAAAAALVWRIWQLFGLLARGRVFDAHAVGTFRALAWTALAALLIDVVLRPVAYAVVSGGQLAFWSSPNDLLHTVVALFIVIIAEVFAAGAVIADDSRQIV